MLEAQTLVHKNADREDHVASAVPKHVALEFGVCSSTNDRRSNSQVRQSIRQPHLTLSSHRRWATLANFRMHA